MARYELVKHNKTEGTFEFFGEPQELDYGTRKSPSNVAEVVDAIRSWLEKNDRITFREILRSADKGNFGDLKESEFISCFKKMGIKLTPEEIRLLKQKLDLKSNNLFEYLPLLKALSGFPTKQFLPLSLIKFAKFV